MPIAQRMMPEREIPSLATDRPVDSCMNQHDRSGKPASRTILVPLEAVANRQIHGKGYSSISMLDFNYASLYCKKTLNKFPGIPRLIKPTEEVIAVIL